MEDNTKTSQDWESMELTYVGEVGQVLKQGGAKLSQDNPEPGELPTKPPGR